MKLPVTELSTDAGAGGGGCPAFWFSCLEHSGPCACNALLPPIHLGEAAYV